MSDIGANIKKFRLAASMTQEELGSRIGVGKSAVQKYEADAVKEIKYSTIVKICSALNVPPSMLMGVNEAPSDDELLSSLDAVIGAGARELVSKFDQLNREGRIKLLDMAIDLVKIMDYRRD